MRITQGEMIGLLTCLVLLINVNHVTAQTDPTSITCSAINTTCLRLAWTSATSTSVVGYQLDIQRVDGLKVEPAIPTVTLADKTYSQYDYNGLGKYGTYNISIHSYTASNNLTDYVTTCVTSEDVPDSAPQNFTCTAYSISAINCSWEALEQQHWNGILLGYKLQWVGSDVAAMYEANISTATIDYSFAGLDYDTKYIFMLCGYTSMGFSQYFATGIEKTFGPAAPEVENKTRYYCYEAVPGMIEFSWDEMPCTIYMGTIAGLFTLCIIFIGIFACQACCSKSAKPSQIEINIDNTDDRPRSYNGHDDERGSSDDEELHADSDDDNSCQTDDDDMEQTAGARKKSMESTLSQNGDIPSPAPLNAGSATPASAAGENGVDDSDGSELSDSDYHTDIEDEEAAIGLTHLNAKTGVVKASKANKVKSSEQTQSKKTKKLVSKNKEKNHMKEKRNVQFVANANKGDDNDEDELYEDWEPDLVSSPNADVTYVQEGSKQPRKRKTTSKESTTASKVGALATKSRTNLSRNSEIKSRNEWDDEWEDEPSLSDKSNIHYNNNSVIANNGKNNKNNSANYNGTSNNYNNTDSHSNDNISGNNNVTNKESIRAISDWDDDDIVINDTTHAYIDETNMSGNGAKYLNTHFIGHMIGDGTSTRKHMAGDASMSDERGMINMNTHHSGGATDTSITSMHTHGVKNTMIPANTGSYTTENDNSEWDDETTITGNSAGKGANVTPGQIINHDGRKIVNSSYNTGVPGGKLADKFDSMPNMEQNQTIIPGNQNVRMTGAIPQTAIHAANDKVIHIGKNTMRKNGINTDLENEQYPANTGGVVGINDNKDNSYLNVKQDTTNNRIISGTHPVNTVNVSGINNNKDNSYMNVTHGTIDDRTIAGNQSSGPYQTQNVNNRNNATNIKDTGITSDGSRGPFSDTQHSTSLTSNTSKGVSNILVKGHNATEMFDSTTGKYASGQSTGRNDHTSKDTFESSNGKYASGQPLGRNDHSNQRNKPSQESNTNRAQNSRQNVKHGVNANKGPNKANPSMTNEELFSDKQLPHAHAGSLKRNTQAGQNNKSGKDNTWSKTNTPEHIDMVHILEVQPELDPRKKRNTSTLHPAWGPERQTDRQVKSGRRTRTPVKSIKPERRHTVTEAEPVLGIDRLGKRFPFLNASIENKNEDRDPSPSNINGWIKKNQSEPNLESMSRNAITAFGSTGSSKMPKSASTSNIEDMNQDKTKVFYGFGVGRFRQLASSWVRKWRMKKKPPKTGQSEWN